MSVFHVYLNRKKLITSGIGKSGVLTAIVHSNCRQEGKQSARSQKKEGERLNLSLGGLDTAMEPHEYISWIDRKLKIGDEVIIRISKNGTVDRPRSRKSIDQVLDQKAQKRHTRMMAKKFGWKITKR